MIMTGFTMNWRIIADPLPIQRCCGLFTHMKSFQYSQKAIGKAVIINTIDKILQNKSANQHRQGRNKNRLKQYAQF